MSLDGKVTSEQQKNHVDDLDGCRDISGGFTLSEVNLYLKKTD